MTSSSEQQLFGLTRISIEEAIEDISVWTVLAVDTETTGLFWKDEELLMIQIYNGTDNYVIDARNTDLSGLQEIFASQSVLKVFHNAKFDVKFLRANGLPVENVYCTMLAEKVLYAGHKRSFALKQLMYDYFDIEMSKEVRNTFIGHKGPFTKEQLIYGLDDTEKLLDIRQLQMAKINADDLQNTLKLENRAVLAFADIEYNGVYLDKEEWSKVAIEVKKEVDMIFEEMEEIIHAQFPEYRETQIDMFGGGRLNTLDYNSPQQMLRFFQRFDKKLESAGAPALQAIKHKHDIVAKYVEYKEKSKLYNAYGPAFYEKYVKSDGRVHTNFQQILDTGRVSSSSPNMQQIPADNTYRNAFRPKSSDWVFVSSDFSAQELCIIATGSQDPVWLKVLREGGDLHGTCAELIFGERWTKLGETNEERRETAEGKKLRTHVKTINFGLAYGMGAFSLSAQLGLTEQEAKDLIKTYFTVFPKIKKFLSGLSKYGRDNGFIRTYEPFRRIRRFPYWDGKNTDKAAMAKIERASKNTPIQGSGADMTKLALIFVRDFIRDNKVPVYLVMTVHDEINTVVRKDYAEEWALKLKEIMEKSAVYIVGEGLLRSDPGITKYWSK